MPLVLRAKFEPTLFLFSAYGIIRLRLSVARLWSWEHGFRRFDKIHAVHQFSEFFGIRDTHRITVQ